MKSYKILGSGCTNCDQLYKNTERAAQQLNQEYQIEKVTDMFQIMTHGVSQTPALAINNKVVSAGRVLTVDEVKKLIG